MTPSSGQLYKLMASGESVPNEIVDDILAEAMVRKADSKVIYLRIKSHNFSDSNIIMLLKALGIILIVKLDLESYQSLFCHFYMYCYLAT